MPKTDCSKPLKQFLNQMIDCSKVVLGFWNVIQGEIKPIFQVNNYLCTKEDRLVSSNVVLKEGKR